jgi:hypothetical protein
MPPMLVTSPLELEALILLLLTMLRAGILIMELNGKSQIERCVCSILAHVLSAAYTLVELLF